MRRRSMYEGHIWLKSIAGELAPQIALRPELTEYSVSEAVHRLCSEYGYLCIFRLDGAAYELRCLPEEGRYRGPGQAVALSYRGSNPASISNSALIEATAIYTSSLQWKASPKELPRWVP